MATRSVGQAERRPGRPKQARSSIESTVLISQERCMIGLEATWEIEALNEAIVDLCDNLAWPDMTQPELMSIRLKVRGLTARIEQLNSAAMSVLGADEATADLARCVYGRRRAG